VHPLNGASNTAYPSTVHEFDEFKAALLGRHTNPLTIPLSNAGDAIILAGLITGLARRSTRPILTLVPLGLAVATAAHLFEPGTVRDEYAAIIRHPVWALRAEVGRVFEF
jgi:hypothetical protein